ncbi:MULTISPECIES: lysophospholipid acyltransferase family protein [Luteimonas]|uniref:1-acyl-sn-glycerol-3-phosphate acyltransferase n=1 Tax=Luteimonas chenhongjianii TaxID=2006110 RepID=A0A290XB84_9GAMM|nr:MULTISPECIES: lysophospholipid acyltransferase family protein [Luteimonas]ATD66412.1 1-acyl-sn-glycerol-3-phosphate acyltransferase [Luteimonas chenhongjianii]RPD85350.1 1-acyl-sn-glycerol-3-phosphate acyltransferase [Luteimonas sp. 100069]
MTSSPDHAEADASGMPARVLRYCVRVPLLIWHLGVDLPILLLSMLPPIGRRRLRSGERVDHRMIRWWQGGLMRVFGFSVRRVGTPLPGATLFVANHVSWIDIVALHSQRMVGFVAKREIAGWPVVGWLAARGETIFHQRGSRESMGGVLDEMVARLREGRPVAVFPEGRTRGGDVVGPFHARIFLAAVEANVPVQPVALRYGRDASAQAVVAFREHESFMANFLRLLGEEPREAQVVFLEPILPGSSDGRRGLAEVSRERIVAALETRA